MIGEPPYAHVMRRRVEYAQEIMRRTHRPLSQIALDCGFADQAHLTRLFRRIAGVSPAVWRRLHLDPN
jgi:AraC family transcriptional regulator